MLVAIASAAAVGCAGPSNDGAAPTQPIEIVAPVETGPRWITIDADAIETARDARVAGVVGSVAVMEIDAGDIHALSQQMHVRHGRCGGFMVHDSLEAAHAALDVRMPRGAIQYTIDNAASAELMLAEVDEANILSLIQDLSAMPSRYYTSSSGIAASTWLRDRWQSYAGGRDDVRVELFTHTDWPQKSVIATITGTTLPDEVIVIGGHLDSINQGGGAAPGADDDASGIATLSEAFRTMMATNFRPNRTVKFMAYAAEEVGLRGSSDIASTYEVDGVDVVGVLQLDMTNYKGSSGDIYLLDDYTSASQNTFVGNLIDTYLPEVTRGVTACGYACSDHASWYQSGFRATMPAESRMSDSNPEIHSEFDTLDMSDNNASHAVKFARLTAVYIAEIAKGRPAEPVLPEPLPAPIDEGTGGDDGGGDDDGGGGLTSGCNAGGGAGLALGLVALFGMRRRRDARR
jgi:leucyl aminopeptidase